MGRLLTLAIAVVYDAIAYMYICIHLYVCTVCAWITVCLMSYWQQQWFLCFITT